MQRHRTQTQLRLHDCADPSFSCCLKQPIRPPLSRTQPCAAANFALRCGELAREKQIRDVIQCR